MAVDEPLAAEVGNDPHWIEIDLDGLGVGFEPLLFACIDCGTVSAAVPTAYDEECPVCVALAASPAGLRKLA